MNNQSHHLMMTNILTSLRRHITTLEFLTIPAAIILPVAIFLTLIRDYILGIQIATDHLDPPEVFRMLERSVHQEVFNRQEQALHQEPDQLCNLRALEWAFVRAEAK